MFSIFQIVIGTSLVGCDSLHAAFKRETECIIKYCLELLPTVWGGSTVLGNDPNKMRNRNMVRRPLGNESKVILIGLLFRNSIVVCKAGRNFKS